MGDIAWGVVVNVWLKGVWSRLGCFNYIDPVLTAGHDNKNYSSLIYGKSILLFLWCYIKDVLGRSLFGFYYNSSS